MVPTDHVLDEGHELALILYGIEAQATQRPDTVCDSGQRKLTYSSEIKLLFFKND